MYYIMEILIVKTCIYRSSEYIAALEISIAVLISSWSVLIPRDFYPDSDWDYSLDRVKIDRNWVKVNLNIEINRPILIPESKTEKIPFFSRKVSGFFGKVSTFFPGYFRTVSGNRTEKTMVANFVLLYYNSCNKQKETFIWCIMHWNNC